MAIYTPPSPLPTTPYGGTGNTHEPSTNQQYAAQSALCNQLLAIGSFDSKIRLVTYQSLTETHVLTLGHPKEVETGLTYPGTGIDSGSDLRGVIWVEALATEVELTSGGVAGTGVVGDENSRSGINNIHTLSNYMRPDFRASSGSGINGFRPDMTLTSKLAATRT